MLRYLLELAGHRVQVVRDGEKGVALAGRWRPAIVISDIGLRGRLNGYEVARERRAGPACPRPYLVALSGRALDEDKARAREAGFNAYATKPIDLEGLERIVAQAARGGW